MNDSSDHRESPRAGEPPSRRDFLDKLLAAGAVVWVGGVAMPAAVYLWPARSAGPGQQMVEAGSVEDFPIGSSRMVQHQGKPIIVLRLGEEEFTALSAICTHLACIVHWDADKRMIACPCHAGFFQPDGTVASGPPPRPLTSYRTLVVGEGELRVVV